MNVYLSHIKEWYNSDKFGNGIVVISIPVIIVMLFILILKPVCPEKILTWKQQTLLNMANLSPQEKSSILIRNVMMGVLLSLFFIRVLFWIHNKIGKHLPVWLTPDCILFMIFAIPFFAGLIYAMAMVSQPSPKPHPQTMVEAMFDDGMQKGQTIDEQPKYVITNLDKFAIYDPRTKRGVGIRFQKGIINYDN